MSGPEMSFQMTRSHGRRTEMNRPKTRTRACFRIIRANGKVEQHILIFDPAELHSLKVNVFIELHQCDRLEHDDFDLRDLTERT
jgi:hypothetical protein